MYPLNRLPSVRSAPKKLLLASVSVASFFAASAFAEPVTLTSERDSIRVSGELVAFTGTEYILNSPELGELRVAADGIVCSGADCPELAFEAGGQATLTGKNGGARLTGTMVSFTDGIYTLKTESMVLTARADDVICEGPGCPSPEVLARGGDVAEEVAPAQNVELAEDGVTPRRPADLVMVGSDNVGEDLMPLVMEPFAEEIGAVSVTEAIEFDDDIAQYVFTLADGSEYVLEVESTSSGPGLERLIDGTTDIAMSSRQAKPEEIAAIAAQGRGNLLDVSQQYIVGVDSVLMTVHNDNPVTELTRQQIAAIYRDEITNWSQVGGPDLPIMPGARDGGSARENFEVWAFGAEGDLSPGTAELDKGKDMRRFVEQNPGAIGYSISDNIGDTKAIDLILDCGVRTEATPFKSKSEEYLLGRRIRLYIDNQNPKPEIRQLVNMMIAPTIDPQVDESGYFSLGIVEDGLALNRLSDAALIGQPRSIGRAVRGDVLNQLAGADRLSLTFRFASDEFVLDSKALQDLDRLVDYMSRRENRDREFIFVGFADAIGQYAYNVGLSRNRANAVLERARSHPEASALAGMNLSTTGFGEAAPVGCNENQRGRGNNRRVEVWVR